MKQLLFLLGVACLPAIPSMGQTYGSDKKVGDKIYTSAEAKSLTAQHTTDGEKITRTTTGNLTSTSYEAPNKRKTVSLTNVNKIKDFVGKTITYSGRVNEIQDKGDKQVVVFSTLKVEFAKPLKLNIRQGEYYSIKGLVKLQDNVPTMYVTEQNQVSILNGADRIEAIISE